MSKKADPKFDTKLEKTVFYYGIISTDVTIANLLKKRAGTKKAYDLRFVVLTRNYIVYYKPVGKEGPPRKYDLPRGVINLKRVLHNDVRIDADNCSVLIPTAERVFEFQSSDDKVLMKWVKTVKERAEAISKVRTEDLTDFHQEIQKIQQTFPFKSFSLSSRVRIEQFDKLVEDRRKYAEDLAKWDPYVRNASLFLECYFGETRHYMDWFVSAEGPSAILQQSDEEALSTYKADVEKALKAAKEIAEIRFFAEDLEETAQQCDRAVESINGINKYSKEFLNNKEENFEEKLVKEKEILQKFALSFRGFPSVRTIDYRTNRGGKITGQNGDEFSFTLAGGAVALKGRSGGTELEFSAQGPELASKNFQFGTVVWNGRIWVWYHNHYPHTVRFDYDPKSGSFRHRPSPSATGGKDTTAYADWVLDSGNLRCVGGAGKKAPSCGVWKVDGDVPICAILLAGMSEIIVQNSNSV